MSLSFDFIDSADVTHPADSQRFPQNPPPRPNEEVRLV